MAVPNQPSTVPGTWPPNNFFDPFFDADGTHSNNVVVLDGGKRFFLLSEAPGTIVMEEGIRLEEEKD